MRADERVQRENDLSRTSVDEPSAPFAPSPAERRRTVDADLAAVFDVYTAPRKSAQSTPQPRTITPRTPRFARNAGFSRVAMMGMAGAVALGLAIGGFVGHEVRTPIQVASASSLPHAHIPPPQPIAIAATAPAPPTTMTVPATIVPVAGGTGDEAPQPRLRPAMLRKRDCDTGSFCARHRVMEADRALRIAYSNAIRAGVPRDQLIAVREHWADLRASQYGRPGRLYASYTDLADDLDEMSRDAQSSWRY